MTDGPRRARPALPIRLDKLLRESVGFTRREAAKAWETGRIATRASYLGDLVFPDDVVRVDGEPVERSSGSRYYLLNKPAGVLTANSDPYGRACLDTWVSDLGPVFPVGRLDRATTGLLLLTDDGDLAHLLLHPRFHITKEYVATLAADHQPTEVSCSVFTAGLELPDGPARALSAEIEATHPNVAIRIEVDEGRNHLVRNMVKVAGFELAALHRIRMGGLQLGTLAEGEVRELSDDEISELWAHVGGFERVWKGRLEALLDKQERWRAEGRPHHRLDEFLESLER